MVIRKSKKGIIWIVFCVNDKYSSKLNALEIQTKARAWISLRRSIVLGEMINLRHRKGSGSPRCGYAARAVWQEPAHRAEQLLLPGLHSTELSCAAGDPWLLNCCVVWEVMLHFCCSCWPFSFPASGILVVFPGRLRGVAVVVVWAVLYPSTTGLIYPYWEGLRCSCFFPRIFLWLMNLLNYLNAAYLMHSRSALYFALLNNLANSR